MPLPSLISYRINAFSQGTRLLSRLRDCSRNSRSPLASGIFRAGVADNRSCSITSAKTTFLSTCWDPCANAGKFILSNNGFGAMYETSLFQAITQ
jgi:hypothetical protein